MYSRYIWLMLVLSFTLFPWRSPIEPRTRGRAVCPPTCATTQYGTMCTEQVCPVRR